MAEVKNETKIEKTQLINVPIKEEVKPTETKPEVKEEKKMEIAKKSHPLSVFRRVDSLFDRLTNWFDDYWFDDFWAPTRFWDFRPFSLRVFGEDEDEFARLPLANVTEDDKQYKITAELPGLEKGDLEVTIHDHELEIKGERKVEHEEKNDDYVCREYSDSTYHRTFVLPEDVDKGKIDAKFDKGVLTLTIPKKPEEKVEAKKVEVK